MSSARIEITANVFMAQSWFSIVAKNDGAWRIFWTNPGNIMAVAFKQTGHDQLRCKCIDFVGYILSQILRKSPFEKRLLYSEGDTPRWRMKARRMRSSSPNPARRATSTTPPISLLSSNSRAVSTRNASTPCAGVIPVRVV